MSAVRNERTTVLECRPERDRHDVEDQPARRRRGSPDARRTSSSSRSRRSRRPAAISSRRAAHARLGDLRRPRALRPRSRRSSPCTRRGTSRTTRRRLPRRRRRSLLPPELVALIPLVQHVPEWLKERYPWQIAGVQHLQLHARRSLAAWGVAHVDPRPRAGGRPRPTCASRSPALAACVVFVGAEPRPARADAEARARPHAPRDRPLHVREPLDRPRARRARRLARGVLALEPVADPVRARAARPRPPLAVACPRSRRRRASTRRPASSTRATSPPRSPRSSRAPSASSGRCR